MSIRYPNADYPTAYDEDEMVKGTDVPVNTAAQNLTVTVAAAGQGPLFGEPVTGQDVKTDMSREPAPKAAVKVEEAVATEDV